MENNKNYFNCNLKLNDRIQDITFDDDSKIFDIFLKESSSPFHKYSIKILTFIKGIHFKFFIADGEVYDLWCNFPEEYNVDYNSHAPNLIGILIESDQMEKLDENKRKYVADQILGESKLENSIELNS